ncbi:MAG: hypothetical protein QM594_03450 [Niabella sp.]
MSTFNRFGSVLLAICSVWLASCSKNSTIELIAPSYKTLEILSGGEIEVPVSTNGWSIASVKYMPLGEAVLDHNGYPLILEGYGQTKAASGWLTLIRKVDDKFTIQLKENFDVLPERKFEIAIADETGRENYVTVIQKRGSGYKLVKSEFKELEDQRSVYKSEEGCSTLALSNPTSEATWKSYGSVFENVMQSSNFESSDYGAFAWLPEETINISVPDLVIDNKMYAAYRTVYKEGITTTPYIKDTPNNYKILVNPYYTAYLKGEITYCKRVCNYTLTVQNTSTGTQFKISGIWTQIVPISSNTIISDK